MNARKFVYVIFIASIPERVWQALTQAEFSRQYWFGRCVESDWRVGSIVKYWIDESRSDLDFSGKVLRSEPPQLLSYSFGVEWGRWVQNSATHKHMLHERPSRVIFELEPAAEVTKLTLVHDEFEPGSKTLEGVSNGWPAILSGLMSVLECGKSLSLDAKARIAQRAGSAPSPRRNPTPDRYPPARRAPPRAPWPARAASSRTWQTRPRCAFDRR